METLINYIQAERVSRSVSRKDLAKAAKISYNALQKIEGGNYLPSIFIAIKLARVLNKKVDELFKVVDHEKI